MATQAMSGTEFVLRAEGFVRGPVPARPMSSFGVIGVVIDITQVYRMRAWWTNPSGPDQYWYWEAEDEPDTDGSESGKTPADLSDIVVIKHFQR